MVSLAYLSAAKQPLAREIQVLEIKVCQDSHLREKWGVG